MSTISRTLGCPSKDVHSPHVWVSPIGGERVHCAGLSVPLCTTPGCLRERAYDGESRGYFSACGRCISAVRSSAGLHAHRHSLTPGQAAANGGPREWTTATTLRPVVRDDVVIRWECRDPLPGTGEWCGYSITHEELEAHDAYRRGEAFLCDIAWAAFKAMRAAYRAQHPVDVR